MFSILYSCSILCTVLEQLNVILAMAKNLHFPNSVYYMLSIVLHTLQKLNPDNAIQVGSVIAIIWQLKILRHREIKWLADDHAVSQSWLN